MSRLVIEKIDKAFQKQQVFKDFSLIVESGEIVCLMGQSGRGKSTILRCIASLEKVDQGTIMIDEYPLVQDGKYVRHQAERQYLKQLSMVFASGNLFPHLTIFENIALPLRNQKNILLYKLRKWFNRVYNNFQLLIKRINIQVNCLLDKSSVLRFFARSY